MSKRKVKKSAILIMGIICFFIIYFASFNYFSNLGKGEGTKIVDTEEKVDARSLLSQFKSKKKYIYRMGMFRMLGWKKKKYKSSNILLMNLVK